MQNSVNESSMAVTPGAETNVCGGLSELETAANTQEAQIDEMLRLFRPEDQIKEGPDPTCQGINARIASLIHKNQTLTGKLASLQAFLMGAGTY